MQIKLFPGAKWPTRSNPTDAGLDLYVLLDTYMIRGHRTLVETGVYTKIPVGHVGLLVPRSSLSKLDITMTNSIGIIDSDYRGQLLASLMYMGHEEGIWLKSGEKIVQLVIVPILLPSLELGDEATWNDTARGEGGFGSTGR